MSFWINSLEVLDPYEGMKEEEIMPIKWFVNKVKPCPICGSKCIFVHTVLYPKSRHYVRCENCTCRGEEKRFLRRAIRSWNRRK